MTSLQSDISPPFAPLPVRARGTLEIFDTAFKLFRRYAGVLLAWSTLSGLIILIPVLGFLSYLFTMPLLYGAVSCVVAGAVRGQNVSFKQVWGFTKPRYGALLGVLILATILMGVVMFALTFGGMLLTLLFTSVTAQFGSLVQAIASIISSLLGLVATSFLLAVVMGWFNLAPVIACLEDANRGSNALSRAWSLLSGNWRKACGVATILSLAGTSAFCIVGGFVIFFFYGGWDKFLGADTANSFLSGLGLSGFFTIFIIAWMPLQAVVGAVFYLDLRTRKEALDLEWTNYAAKPETLPDQLAPAPVQQFAPSFPVGNSPYAPASLSPTPQPNVAPPIFDAQTPLQPPAAPPVFGAQTPLQPPASPPVFGAQSVQHSASQQNIPAPSDSFAEFAAQVENAPAPDRAPLQPPTISIEKPLVGTPPFSVEAPQATPISTRHTVVTPSFANQNPSIAPVESLVAPLEQPTVAPIFAPVTSVQAPPNEAPSVPVAIEPPPVPLPIEPVPAAPPALEPGVTSSFSPPPRFRRAASEEDNNPSSFGGPR